MIAGSGQPLHCSFSVAGGGDSRTARFRPLSPAGLYHSQSLKGFVVSVTKSGGGDVKGA